jgi:hypothetical protein
MDPLAQADLASLTTDQLELVAAELERRRPGAPVPSVGVRPRRQPWTYRDIWRLDAIRDELERRRSSRAMRAGP